jgi:hypothetical protein
MITGWNLVRQVRENDRLNHNRRRSLSIQSDKTRAGAKKISRSKSHGVEQQREIENEGNFQIAHPQPKEKSRQEQKKHMEYLMLRKVPTCST